MRIGAVDLFCGVGGLTCGIQRSGIKVVAGIDIDYSCKYPYERNNETSFIHKSINDITGKYIKDLLKDCEIKVLIGCAPCQPFSSHRKNKKDRKSHKDWSLLYQFARLIKTSKPDYVSMENVPELIHEQVFLDFVSLLNCLNYKTTYSVVNVVDYGIAQTRKRLILLSSKVSKIELIPPTHIARQICVRDVIGGLPEVEAGEICLTDRLHISSKLSDINLRRMKASRPNGSWRDWPEELILSCHKKDTGKSYGSVYGRMSWDDLAPTITTQFINYGTGRYGHPSQDRALTLREGALLQSFPMEYEFVSIDNPIFLKSIAKQIGNAVPPRLGEIVGFSILNSLSK